MSDAISKTGNQPGASSRSFGSSAWIILTTIAIFFASQFIGVFLVKLFAAAFGLEPLIGSILESSALAQFFYILIAEGLAAGLAIWTVRRRGLSMAKIGLGRRPAWRDASWAIGGLGVLIVALIIITAVISGLWHGYNTNQLQDDGFRTVTSASGKFIAFISLVIIPPLGEEPLMRGYLYGGLRTRWNIAAAAAVTSLIFGAAHLLTGASGLLWAAGVDTFILSLILIYLREKTGALYAGMGLHALNNVLAFIVYFHS